MRYVSTVNLPSSFGAYVVAGVHFESCMVGVPARPKWPPKFGRAQKHLFFILSLITTILDRQKPFLKPSDQTATKKMPQNPYQSKNQLCLGHFWSKIVPKGEIMFLAKNKYVNITKIRKKKLQHVFSYLGQSPTF